jgi:hypothetical protein
MDFQQQLQALRLEFTNELARRDAQVESLSSIVTNLRGNVASLQIELESKQSRNTTDSSSKRPKRQLPDPPKFDGTQLHYDTWLAQLQLVLSVDSEAIGNAQAQFAFVYLRLESGPAALCLELLKHANLTNTYDYQLILDQLDRHNGVENKVQRAKTKLHKLSQTGSFHGFLISFEVTLGEANGWNWDDERKIDTLRPCLSDYLKRKLQEHDVAGTTPSSYLEFVLLCKRYASQTTPTSSGFANTPGTVPNQHRSLYDPKSTDKMDISNIDIGINTISVDSPSSSPRSFTSSLNDRSRCFRCGSIDHYVSVCPHPPRITPGSSQKQVRIQTVTPASDTQVQFQPSQNSRILARNARAPVHVRSKPDTMNIKLQDLEKEVNIMGIDAVLDLLMDHRYENGIWSGDEEG